MAPSKKGIFSIDFSPSLSCLQAFSICISVLDSRNQLEILESSSLLEEKPLDDETRILPNNGATDPTQIEGEIPARFISFPPVSPVGRV